MSVFMPMMYNVDSSGNTRVWRIEVSGDRYRSYAGLVDGKHAVSGWTVCTPKNVGTKVETTPEQQAIVEAEAEYVKKSGQGWTENLDDAGKAKPFKPMLAHTFDPEKHDVQDWLRSQAIFSQPKLDGVRCVATRHGLFSRSWKPLLSTPHIYSALQPVFEDYPDLILDGELYTHRLSNNFNEIISLVKKGKPKAEDLLKSEEFVEFHVFDLFHPEMAFLDRYNRLTNILDTYQPSKIIPVSTSMVYSQTHLDELMAQYTEQGYEGQMIRFHQPYENKRSKHLLKRKEFKTAEFKLKRIEEGNGNWLGCAKRIVLWRPDDMPRGPNGEDDFEASMRGTQEFARELLNNADQYVGTPTTIRFQDYTPDGVPRFGVAIEFNRDDHHE